MLPRYKLRVGVSDVECERLDLAERSFIPLLPSDLFRAETIRMRCGRLRRGIERGEIDANKLTERIDALPLDLIRHETLMTNRAATTKAVTEIVDSIFLPLVTSKQKVP